MTATITTRELLQQFPKIRKGLAKGNCFKLTSHGKLVGELYPPFSPNTSGAEFSSDLPVKLKKGELLGAFRKIQFKSGDPLLSRKVDTYLYGAPYDPTRY